MPNAHIRAFMDRFAYEGLTFDDVSLVTRYADFLPEDRCPYNSLLWDGNVFFIVVATTDTPGRVEMDTRRNLQRYRELILQRQTLLWHWPGPDLERQLLTAGHLQLRPAKERAGASDCQVIEGRTSDAHYLLWLDPDRGCNLVKARMWDRQGSMSNALDQVVCKEDGGIWIPMEGVLTRSRLYANGGYERGVDQLRITALTMNPDHEVLRSFFPDDIRNGAWVQINPSVGDRFNPRNLPIWQDGKVVARDGRILMDFSRHLQRARLNQEF